jgi:hypothetical protein
MTLIKPLADLVAQIKDENDRKFFEQAFPKYSFLVEQFEGNLRQQDYDRLMNETKTARQKEQEEVTRYKEDQRKWKEWADKNIPLHEELVRNYDDLEKKYKEAEDKLEEAARKAASGDGMNGDNQVNATELLNRVREEVIKKGGYATEAQMQKIADEVAKKMVTEEASKLRENFYKTDFPNAIAFMTAMNELQYKNREEFGEPLDTKAFSKFIADNKIDDPEKAWKEFTSEKRSAKEKEKIVKDTTEKLEKEWASKYNLPGSGASPMPELGHLHARQLGKNDVVDESKPGWLQAAESLRTEGKF